MVNRFDVGALITFAEKTKIINKTTDIFLGAERLKKEKKICVCSNEPVNRWNKLLDRSNKLEICSNELENRSVELVNRSNI